MADNKQVENSEGHQNHRRRRLPQRSLLPARRDSVGGVKVLRAGATGAVAGAGGMETANMQPGPLQPPLSRLDVWCVLACGLPAKRGFSGRAVWWTCRRGSGRRTANRQEAAAGASPHPAPAGPASAGGGRTLGIASRRVQGVAASKRQEPRARRRRAAAGGGPAVGRSRRTWRASRDVWGELRTSTAVSDVVRRMERATGND